MYVRVRLLNPQNSQGVAFNITANRLFPDYIDTWLQLKHGFTGWPSNIVNSEGRQH